jgi:hypothetical protein
MEARMARGQRRDSKKESFWRAMVLGHSGSGLSVRAWCRRRGLREPAFYWWRRQLVGRDGENSAATFVPVRIADDAFAAGAAAMGAVAAGAGRIEIVLAGERRVLLIGPVDRSALRAILSVLSEDFSEDAAEPTRAAEALPDRSVETRAKRCVVATGANARVAEASRC